MSDQSIADIAGDFWCGSIRNPKKREEGYCYGQTDLIVTEVLTNLRDSFWYSTTCETETVKRPTENLSKHEQLIKRGPHILQWIAHLPIITGVLTSLAARRAGPLLFGSRSAKPPFIKKAAKKNWKKTRHILPVEPQTAMRRTKQGRRESWTGKAFYGVTFTMAFTFVYISSDGCVSFLKKQSSYLLSRAPSCPKDQPAFCPGQQRTNRTN